MESVNYEQCPWDEGHVRAIYRRLSEIVADGEWHLFPDNGARGHYRVFEGRTFQVIFGKGDEAVYPRLLQLDPPDIEDDAEWTVLCDPEEDVVLLTSTFCRTFGPFSGINLICETLNSFALELIKYRGDIWGAVYVEDIETDMMEEAMARLRAIEKITLQVNKAIDAQISTMWDDLTAEMREAEEASPEEEVLDIPASYRPRGPKFRQPL